MTIRPCGNCPWRKDAPRGYWHPEHFRAIARECRDDGTHTMGCHKSTPERQMVCAGWLGVIGYESIGARILALQGGPTPGDVSLEGLGMFAGYDDMLAANGVDIPPRNTVSEQALARPRVPGDDR